jgi:hypothetical protein
MELLLWYEVLFSSKRGPISKHVKDWKEQEYGHGGPETMNDCAGEGQ